MIVAVLTIKALPRYRICQRKIQAFEWTHNMAVAIRLDRLFSRFFVFFAWLESLRLSCVTEAWTMHFRYFLTNKWLNI
jgi:hypothetical protein